MSGIMVNPSKIISSPTLKIQCRKAKFFRGGKKSSTAPNDVKPTKHQTQCIVYKQDNLTSPSGTETVNLPVKILPGMKVTAYGAYDKEFSYTMFSTVIDPEDPANVANWLHTRVAWGWKGIAVTVGFSDTKFKMYPISDPSHFTVTYELTESETKIYVNKELVTTKEAIPWTDTVVLKRFSTVYLLVVQKTGEDCDGVDSGLP